MNIEEIINKKIEERIDKALEKYFSGSEDTNIPAPEKTDRDLYMEEFALLQSRPGLTRKELREDKRWQEFLAKRPGPKMETVYNDYLCHLERERLAQENADLRKRLAEVNAEFVDLKLRLDKPFEFRSDVKAVKLGSCEVKDPSENDEVKASTPIEWKQIGPSQPKMVYLNLKQFITNQKLKYCEFVELLGIRKGTSKHADQVYLSHIINGDVKKLDKFWDAVQKTFDLTDEELSELKKKEEAK